MYKEAENNNSKYSSQEQVPQSRLSTDTTPFNKLESVLIGAKDDTILGISHHCLKKWLFQGVNL